MTGSRKLDARQVKSKAALFTALDALLGERSYGELTIIDLVERAGIGRQTFYRHFVSIDAMLEEKLRIDLEEQLAMAKNLPLTTDKGNWFARLAAFAFERAGKNPRLYRLILSGEAGNQALRLLRVQIGNMLAAAPAMLKPADDLDEYVTFVESFYAGAISAMLLAWLEADDQPPPDAMGDLFVQLTKGQSQSPS